jgi:hypothetical protein
MPKAKTRHYTLFIVISKQSVSTCFLSAFVKQLGLDLSSPNQPRASSMRPLRDNGLFKVTAIKNQIQWVF